MSILCLTGWQQPAAALEEVAPGALHVDYGAYEDIATMFAALPPEPGLAVGWSLGGQLLARAIAAGFVKPKTLLLIAAPFQCARDDDFPEAMTAEQLQEFRQGYIRSPLKALRQFDGLLALGDRYDARIRQRLGRSRRCWKHGLYWFDTLVAFSCKTIDFNCFPPTVIVHGKNDAVIAPANAGAFAQSIERSQTHILTGCGHCPHLHDARAVREIIQNHV